MCPSVGSTVYPVCVSVESTKPCKERRLFLYWERIIPSLLSHSSSVTACKVCCHCSWTKRWMVTVVMGGWRRWRIFLGKKITLSLGRTEILVGKCGQRCLLWEHSSVSFDDVFILTCLKGPLPSRHRWSLTYIMIVWSCAGCRRLLRRVYTPPIGC